MQNLKTKFQEKTLERRSTLQACIRTNDIDLWGDGTHLCFFRMLGCFSFGNKEDYPRVVDLWLDIIEELGLEITTIHVHPDSNHRSLFGNKGYEIIDDCECVWSDGNVGGYCSEFYVGDVEIGNLVNPMGDSVDVGFGLERICKLLGENYDQTYDLRECLNSFWTNGFSPGTKGKSYTVRKVLRKYLSCNPSNQEIESLCLFGSWIPEEITRREKALKIGFSLVRRHRDKPYEWWYDTTGLMPEEVDGLLKR